MRHRSFVVLLMLGASMSARADLVDFKFGGQIASDIRYRLGGATIPAADAEAPFPSQQRLLGYGFSRNENLIKAQLSMTIADRVKAVADVDFYWYGYSDVRDIDSLTLRERVDPYRLDADAAYIDIYHILPKLDLRIGRQIVVWGAADKFSPTNNLNSLDFSDPLLFGKSIANQMIRFDWNPWRDLIITAVWVPIFRPAQLPRTAPLAVTQIERFAPVQDVSFQNQLRRFEILLPPPGIRATALQPDPSIENSQIGVRIAGRLLGQDLSLSYYRGRFGLPVPAAAISQADGTVDAYVMWPRMQVLGLDVAGSIKKLNGLGYWVEAGLFFPQEVTYAVYNWIDNPRAPAHGPITYKYVDGQFQSTPGVLPENQRGVVIPSTPFLKLTAGFDYSFNKYIYGNFQYVHGFIDEFGAGTTTFSRSTNLSDPARRESRIGEYLVLGTDVKVFNDALLLRFFGAFKIPDIGDEDPKFTAVLFPQAVWSVWDATELTLGAFVFLGPRDSKFGDPVAGASEIFAKAKFTY